MRRRLDKKKPIPKLEASYVEPKLHPICECILERDLCITRGRDQLHIIFVIGEPTLMGRLILISVLAFCVCMCVL